MLTVCNRSVHSMHQGSPGVLVSGPAAVTRDKRLRRFAAPGAGAGERPGSKYKSMSVNCGRLRKSERKF